MYPFSLQTLVYTSTIYKHSSYIALLNIAPLAMSIVILTAIDVVNAFSRHVSNVARTRLNGSQIFLFQ